MVKHEVTWGCTFVFGLALRSRSQAFLQLLVADGEGHVLVDLALKTLLDARGTRATP